MAQDFHIKEQPEWNPSSFKKPAQVNIEDPKGAHLVD